uniref:Uncharacterized protein n=1 Tax=Fagus sylvatica TaxID=28930 RepID=A0A2N9G919_FAGSY
MGSNSNINQPQEKWVININRIFRSDDVDFRSRAFIVPDSLRASKPEVYIPQVVGLGPLHHTRLELQSMHMHMYKLGVVRKFHNTFGVGQNGIEFGNFILELEKRVIPFVSDHCYPMHLDANHFGIAYIMAIDGTRNGILRDTMMLENQIPMLVLSDIFFYMPKSDTVGSCENNLPQMLLGYCKALSPLKVLENYPASIALKHAHLLELLYHLIMLTEPPEAVEEARTQVRTIATVITEVLSATELAKGLIELPWSKLYPSYKAPVEKEILIPTASKLCDVGVQFLCTNHVTAIGFERDTVSFKLPFMKLDVNTEVIIRNLVAYEQISKLESESLVLTRYFELMNGIIETEEDVKVLKDHGILQSESMKDDEVVKIFSGMSKPVRLANVHDLDKAIAEVNNYYNGTIRVKTLKFIKKCVRPWWNFIRKFLGAILLFLMAVQVFCSVYGCSRNCNKSN